MLYYACDTKNPIALILMEIVTAFKASSAFIFSNTFLTPTDYFHSSFYSICNPFVLGNHGGLHFHERYMIAA